MLRVKPLRLTLLLALMLPFASLHAQSGALTENPTGCVENYDPAVNYFPDQVVSDYAVEWEVEYFNHYKVVTVVAPASSVEDTYVLVQCGTPAPELTGNLQNAYVFNIPVERIWEAGGATFAALETLDLSEAVIGVADAGGFDNLPGLLSRFSAGEFPAVGYEAPLESIVAADPDVYFTYDGADVEAEQRAVGIPTVHYDPFTESPLGSAEQIKFVSLFFNLEGRASTIFDPIASRYLALRELAQTADARPTVLLGAFSNDGSVFRSRPLQRIEAQFVLDAGGTLILQDADLPGDDLGFAVDYAIEDVIVTGSDADFWFSTQYLPSQETAEEFIEAQPLNENISALGAGNMFHRFQRGQDYFYTGALYVDLILRDMISILHPELLSDYTPIFLERIPGL
jgi:iron complex transport system substrate-binding protein